MVPMGRGRRRETVRWLAAGDAVALVAFVLVGVADHAGGRLPLASVLRTGVPVLAAWFGLAPFLGTYRRPGLPSLLWTWAAAVPLGVVVRGLVLHRPFGTGFLIFLGVALAFSLAFLVSGRLLLAVLVRLRRASARPAPR